MATSTFGASPGVVMSWSEMWTWKAETPASVPAGARISAGNSGSVARSLPSQRADAGEPVAGELHAVAGVAGEADHHPVERLARRPRWRGVSHPPAPLVPRYRPIVLPRGTYSTLTAIVPIDHWSVPSARERGAGPRCRSAPTVRRW